MMLISEWVKGAAHTQIILHEKVFPKTKVLQTCQKNKAMLTKTSEPLWRFSSGKRSYETREYNQKQAGE